MFVLSRVWLFNKLMTLTVRSYRSQYITIDAITHDSAFKLRYYRFHQRVVAVQYKVFFIVRQHGLQPVRARIVAHQGLNSAGTAADLRCAPSRLRGWIILVTWLAAIVFVARDVKPSDELADCLSAVWLQLFKIVDKFLVVAMFGPVPWWCVFVAIASFPHDHSSLTARVRRLYLKSTGIQYFSNYQMVSYGRFITIMRISPVALALMLVWS